MPKELVVYLNGKYVEKSKATVSVLDHGLLYGDGVFEGIRAYDGSVFRLADHVNRLYESAKVIQIEIPLNEHELTEVITETLRRNNLRNAYIRVVVTRGTGDLGIDPSLCEKPTLFVITEPVTSLLGPKESRVIHVSISSVRRDRVDATSHEVKSLNYLNSILAKMEASATGADDAIMLDSRGFVSEASVTNVFLVKGGKLSTPPSAAGILHGITRARIIQLCDELGLEVRERDITPFELMTADEVFLVGTKSEIRAVGSVNGRTIGTGAAGPTTKQLLQEFGKIVLRRDEGIPIFETESVSA
jgi:branched-chain amino acid aminotransferase